MEEEKSKSQKKREAEALQDLGVMLSKLSAQQLATIPLSDDLRESINQARRIKTYSAQKRHAQLIGRLMREHDDVEAIQAAYDKIVQGDMLGTARFHLVEQWRERLMTGDANALTEFITAYPNDEIQQLRQLIRQGILERDKPQNRGSARALFRLIKRITE